MPNETDIRLQMSEVGYLGETVQRIARDLQDLGYSLTSIHNRLDQPLGPLPGPRDFHHIAGRAAGLKAQVGQALAMVEKLMFEAERVSPKDQG
jgi:hypothetical protein